MRTYHVRCLEKECTYNQNSERPPTICGCCGGEDIEVVRHLFNAYEAEDYEAVPIQNRTHEFMDRLIQFCKDECISLRDAEAVVVATIHTRFADARLRKANREVKRRMARDAQNERNTSEQPQG
jgi:hypothetical protein